MKLVRAIGIASALLSLPVNAEELSPVARKPDPMDGRPVPYGCSRLKKGESLVVDLDFSESHTGVEAHYGLSRPKDDVYLVEIRPLFSRGPGYEGGLKPAELQQKYLDKMNVCMKEYEGLLKNERAGRLMILRTTENPSVPAVRIQIGEPDRRDTAYHYSSNIDCETMLHEMMHLLGLADEYQEPGAAQKGVDCRATGPEDSLMNHHWEAAKKLRIPEKVMSVEMCRCAVKGSKCWELSAKVNGTGKDCPPGTEKFLREIDPDMKTSLNALNSTEAFVLNEEKLIQTGEAPPKHVSMLYPAHFRAITEPGCRDVNENYYGCVINAYRASKLFPYSQPDENSGCLPLPPACRFGSKKWLE